MALLDKPKTWIPYMNSKDCSQGFCSMNCPQWCYVIFPPPPPLDDEFPDDNNSSPIFSPLVIAIIVASAFLLVSYYIIISKFCGNNNDSARRIENQDLVDQEMEDNHNPSLHEPWHVSTTGLDEVIIKSITMVKYKKGDGLIEGTDCSVCLSEFQEDESLRLLPKCSHAFHVYCIDTWLKSHSNCPLCRANIVFISAAALPPLPPPVMESLQANESSHDSHRTNGNAAVTQDIERVVSEEEIEQNNGGDSKTPLRVFSDLGNLQERDAIIQIRDERYPPVRRSFSMDHPCQNRCLAADILQMNQDEVILVEDCLSGDAAESSKRSAQVTKHSHRRRVLHYVLSPARMKRSFSSGRFFLNRHGNAV
ncbi:hypothetical protein P3X46_032242 [Hevea brasiliensis]|uniref:RING-type E3 ubiquitin transferase n=1 Tax=Hevea brasiliensis TaxID=3981 RepID=A0ABQ9KCP6_HEVBR|nr:E3 ubiquitin-protein ligase Os04g0590900 [Hevea brasiliensis]XP_021680179.2 E3 ubiquitin-protein ligase Os04g0590900 [Hevea brasiliensis]KAJ9135018.1 hypothetical protein P3X46_032242 [Hevea brasiliensis]